MLELIETVVGAVTLITLGSLWLVNQIDRREYEDESELEILPFEHVRIGRKCPKCRCESRNPVLDRRGFVKEPACGPRVPVACNGKCKVKTPHLHAYCDSCKAKWLMRPADAS